MDFGQLCSYNLKGEPVLDTAIWDPSHDIDRLRCSKSAVEMLNGTVLAEEFGGIERLPLVRSQSSIVVQ